MRAPHEADAACNVNLYGATRLALVVAVLAGALLVSGGSASAAACFPQPSSCGYPDATNTGVPAGTTLTSSGSVTLSSGQTMNAKNVTGSVNVTGPNVTIENSKIHTTGGGSGVTAITLQNGATNFKLINSEVYGNGSKTNAPESGVWNHYNNAGAQVIGSYIHGSPDNWEGRVDLVKDSYMIVDAEYSGAHSENIYICGSNAAVEHSTLYNESDETSLIFGDGICGKGNTVSVINSMLAGGGFMLEPNAKGVSAPVTITGNRVGRCTTSASQDPWGGYVCSGGADANGYWPRGGHYGISADLGNNATWSGNIWDDNSQAVCASGNPGCGGTTPPPPPPDNPAQAVWTAPTGVTVGVPVTLNGSASTGDAPIACTWTRETQAGSVLDTKTGCQISYTFQSSGTQYMRLKVTDLDGDTNSSVKAISVAEATTPPPPPPPDNPAQAIWTAPANAVVGVPVELDGSASGGDAPLACTWSFEDQAGTTVWETHTGCKLSFTFQVADTKYVRLTVTDAGGETASNRQSFSVAPASAPVEEPAPTPPPTQPVPPALVEPEEPAQIAVQAIWYLPARLPIGQTVTLDGTPSKGEPPLSCTWTIESKSGSRIYKRVTGCTFAYKVPRGTEYVRLTVRDRYGKSDSLRRAVTGQAQTTTTTKATKTSVRRLHSRFRAGVYRGRRAG